ncbi:hypothetical protein GIB67_042433 [Kingdonia uniflora]|uniref:RNase H type-1 domain-containing protein n=1 Tax=Kingdonia uniflora TaxID=39325 RepID=A0A7J7M8M1_9MAGN|nr:hypothetical protein GIB67_042433 [Kingdonia uniflora]
MPVNWIQNTLHNKERATEKHNKLVEIIMKREQNGQQKIRYAFSDKETPPENAHGYDLKYQEEQRQETKNPILRKDKGSPIKACPSCSKKKPIIVLKLISIDEGLKMAVDEGKKMVIVQTDSRAAINIVKSLWDPPWEARATILSIRESIIYFEFFDISLVFKETNKVATFLACLLKDYGYKKIEPTDFSVSLQGLIKDDANDKTYYKTILV